MTMRAYPKNILADKVARADARQSWGRKPAHIYSAWHLFLLFERQNVQWGLASCCSYDGRLVGYAQIFPYLPKAVDVSAIYKINSAHSWDSMNCCVVDSRAPWKYPEDHHQPRRVFHPPLTKENAHDPVPTPKRRGPAGSSPGPDPGREALFLARTRPPRAGNTAPSSPQDLGVISVEKGGVAMAVTSANRPPFLRGQLLAVWLENRRSARSTWIYVEILTASLPKTTTACGRWLMLLRPACFLQKICRKKVDAKC